MKDDSQDLRTLLKNLGHKLTAPSDTHLFLPGDNATCFYLVESGEVRIYKLGGDGREIELRRAGPGDLIAEVFVFAEGKYPVAAQTTCDSSLIRYNRIQVLSASKKNPRLAAFFIKTLAQRCVHLNQIIDDYFLQDISVRLARFLLNQALEPNKPRTTITLGLPKKDLASILGTVPETLSRSFKKLEQLGLAKNSGKTVTISDLKKLRNYAQL